MLLCVRLGIHIHISITAQTAKRTLQILERKRAGPSERERRGKAKILIVSRNKFGIFNFDSLFCAAWISCVFFPPLFAFRTESRWCIYRNELCTWIRSEAKCTNVYGFMVTKHRTTRAKREKEKKNESAASRESKPGLHTFSAFAHERMDERKICETNSIPFQFYSRTAHRRRCTGCQRFGKGVNRVHRCSNSGNVAVVLCKVTGENMQINCTNCNCNCLQYTRATNLAGNFPALHFARERMVEPVKMFSGWYINMGGRLYG